MSVCPSVHKEQFRYQWKEFHEIWHLMISLSAEKIQVVSISNKKKTGTWQMAIIKLCCVWLKGFYSYLAWTKPDDSGFTLMTFRWILLVMRNVSDKICTEHLNSNFMFHNVLFRNSCLLWDNMETARPQMIIKYDAKKFRFACRITKVRKQTHNHNM